MGRTVDYYLVPQSPWTYLGHERFAALLRETGSAVRVLPMDLGRIFPVSGGLPLHKRAPQRQAYRLLELRRFSEALDVPIHPEPRFFPVAGDPAALLITAVALHDGDEAAMRLTGAVLAAVWAQQRDIAAPAVLAELLAETGLDVDRLTQSGLPEVRARYDAQTQAAMDLQVFGAPSYVIDGELFWGQDRLDFVAQRLRA
jgi:2-hydroxychromene-2-carboxylate isomerase